MKLRPTKTATELDSALTTDGGARGKNLSQIRTVTVNVPAARVDQAIARLQRNPAVEKVSRAVSMGVAAAPNDSSYSQQWALPKIAWDQANGVIPITGSATIAVLDTGINASHPDLSGRVVSSVSFTGGNPLTDPHGHGTLLAGIAGARTNNAAGIAGVAYAGVNLASVQVLQADGTGDDADIVDGVLWAADNGANVILMGFSSPDYSEALADAIEYAWGKGAIVVAATGNGGSAAATYPSGMPHVLGVASTTQSDTLASNSNTGSANVAAPGVGILTTTTAGGYANASGTSAAVAHVAGLAGMLSANGKSNAYIYDQVRWATAPIAGQAFGRINVKTALGAALTGPAGSTPARPPAGPASPPRYSTAVGTLSNVSLVASTLTNGALATWTINFTPQTALTLQDHVDIKFPAGFNLTTVNAEYDPTGVPGVNGTAIVSGFKSGTFVYQVLVTGQEIELDLYNYSGGAEPQILDAGVPASISISGVTNGTAPFTLGTFEIWSSQDQVTRVNPSSISAAGAVVDHLVTVAPAGPQTAGTPFNLTSITAVDAGGATITSYSGSKTITYTLSGTANGPTAGTDTYTTTVNFTNGVATTTLATTLFRAQTTTIKAHDAALPGTDVASAAFTVNAGAVDHLTTVAPAGPQTVGVPFNLTSVTAKDAYGNTQASYSGAKTLSYSLSGAANGPTSGTDTYTTAVNFTNGVATTTLATTLFRAQSTTVKAHDAALAGTDIASASFTVNGGAADHLTTVAPAGPQTAGSSFNLTSVTANDIYGNTATGYAGAKTLSYTLSGTANSPTGSLDTYTTAVSFTNGVATTTLATNLKRAQTTNVKAHDAALAGTDVASSNFVVNAGAFSAGDSTVAVGSGTVTNGGTTTVTVTVKDSLGNPITTGTVVPSLTGGGTSSGTFGAVTNVGDGTYTSLFTANTAGTAKTVSATYNGTPISSTLPTITVNAGVGPVDHLVTVAPAGPQTVGVPFNLTSITAVDSGGATVTSYSGSKTLTYTLSGTANGPSSGTDTYTTTVNFTNGVATTTLATTLFRAQTTTVKAHDAALGGTDVASASFVVNAGAANYLTTAAPAGPQTAGSSFNLTSVTAKDIYGNTATGYSGAKTLSYTLSGTANGPSGALDTYTTSVSFTNGVATTTLATTLQRAQNTTVKAHDAALAGIDVASASFAVNAGAFSATQSTVAVGSGTISNGGTTTVTVTAKDAAGNPITTGTVVPSLTGGGTSDGTFGAVTNNGNGTYTSTFTATTIGTAKTVSATYNGTPISSTLPTITVVAIAPPVLQSATTSADGTQIILTFDKAMADPTGKHGEFSFNDGTGRTFSAAALGAPTTKIVLTVVGAPIATGATVTASYTAGTVLAADTGVLASFAGSPVTNAVPGPVTPPVETGGGGGGGGGGGFPSAPVAPTVKDNLGNAVPGFDPVAQPLNGGGGAPTVVSTLVVNVTNSGPDQRQTLVTISVPPAAIPGAERIVVQSVSTIDSLLQQAPMPSNQGRVLSAVSAQVFNAQDIAIKTDFATPVGISALVPPTAVPPGALASNFTMAFWNGSSWIEVPSRATFQPDGSVKIDANVIHFTLYAVKYRGVRGYVAPAVYGSGTVGAVVFIAGGNFEDLVQATRRENAGAVWAQDSRGIFRLLIIDGPEFLKAEFYAAFPEGFPNFTAMTVVKLGSRNEASPDEGPRLAAPTVAPVAAPAPAVTAPAPVAPANAERYTVSSTDTLSDIAVRYGVDWMAIANANNIAGPNYYVRPGQVLVIPGKTASTTPAPAPAATPAASSTPAAGEQRYTVTSTDILSDIALRFGVEWLAIANANGITGPNYVVRPGQVLVIPAGGTGSRTHTVSATDTLSELGTMYGVSWLRIAEVNGIGGPNYFVRPGQVLTIPSR